MKMVVSLLRGFSIFGQPLFQSVDLPSTTVSYGPRPSRSPNSRFNLLTSTPYRARDGPLTTALWRCFLFVL